MKEKISGGSHVLAKIIGFANALIHNAYLVAVSTPSRQSAFRVFSVLNNRGLDLFPSDIIKAESTAKRQQMSEEEFSERWEDKEVLLGRDSYNALLSHIRMIFAGLRFSLRLEEN